MQQVFLTASAAETQQLGRRIGGQLRGGEVIELISDLGGGKTTFVGGLVAGFGSVDGVSSPSFTISNMYQRADGKEFHHFDFYRLSEAGIIAAELAEVEEDANAVVAVEWGDIVHDILPENRIVITIAVGSDDESRRITAEFPKEQAYLFKQ